MKPKKTKTRRFDVGDVITYDMDQIHMSREDLVSSYGPGPYLIVGFPVNRCTVKSLHDGTEREYNPPHMWAKHDVFLHAAAKAIQDAENR